MNQCPECKAKIISDLPDLERLDSSPCEPGDVVMEGCPLGNTGLRCDHPHGHWMALVREP